MEKRAKSVSTFRQSLAHFMEEERRLQEEEWKKQHENVPINSLWRMHHARWRTHISGFISILVVSGFFLILLFLFVGAGWKPATYYKHVKIAIVDYDGGIVGSQMISAAQTPLLNTNFTYTIFTGLSVPTLDHLVADVDNDKYHAAIVVHPGTSSVLLDAMAHPTNATLQQAASTLGVDMVWDEGWVGVSLASLLRAAMLRLVLVGAKAKVTGAVFYQVQQGNLPPSVPPSLLASPFALRERNLARVQYPGIAASTGVVVIIFWTSSLLATNVAVKLTDPLSRVGVRRDHILLMRIGYLCLFTWLLALWPPVVIKGLGATMSSNTFGHLWFFYWLCILTFGGASMTLLLTLGDTFGNLLHLLFMMLNYITSSGVQPLELAPPFYKLGYALPMYQAATGGRSIIFKSYSILGRNVGVLFAWIGLYAILAARFIILERRRVRQFMVKTGHMYSSMQPMAAGGRPRKGEAMPHSPSEPTIEEEELGDLMALESPGAPNSHSKYPKDKYSGAQSGHPNKPSPLGLGPTSPTDGLPPPHLPPPLAPQHEGAGGAAAGRGHAAAAAAALGGAAAAHGHNGSKHFEKGVFDREASSKPVQSQSMVKLESAVLGHPHGPHHHGPSTATGTSTASFGSGSGVSALPPMALQAPHGEGGHADVADRETVHVVQASSLDNRV